MAARHGEADSICQFKRDDCNTANDSNHVAFTPERNELSGDGDSCWIGNIPLSSMVAQRKSVRKIRISDGKRSRSRENCTEFGSDEAISC